MSAPAREMVRYTDPSGRVMARIFQGVRVDAGITKPAYIAETADGAITRERFKCARDVVEQWAHRRGVRLTGQMV